MFVFLNYLKFGNVSAHCDKINTLAQNKKIKPNNKNTLQLKTDESKKAEQAIATLGPLSCFLTSEISLCCYKNKLYF